jgi:hypothetical protein
MAFSSTRLRSAAQANDPGIKCAAQGSPSSALESSMGRFGAGAEWVRPGSENELARFPRAKDPQPKTLVPDTPPRGYGIGLLCGAGCSQGQLGR